jgi:hypothetical protein
MIGSAMSSEKSAQVSKRRQFAPSGPKLNKFQTLIRPVSQVQLQLKKSSQDKDLFLDTVHHVLRWLGNKAGPKLPKEAWDGMPFTMAQIGAQPTGVLTLDKPRYWTARIDDADKRVPQRTWTVEIGVGQTEEGDVLFGARLICATRGEDLPFERSLPAFVKSVLRGREAKLDKCTLAPGPINVNSESAVEAMVSLLEDPTRRCPVVAISLSEGCSDFSLCKIDANFVYNKTLGAAHIFVLSGNACFHLTNKIGKEFSVYREAIRLYRPGFNRAKDDSFGHPLTLASRIEQVTAELGEHAYEELLSSQALAVTAYAPDREDALPSFDKIRRIIADKERKGAEQSGSSDSALLELADAEILRLESDLSQQKDTYDGLLLSLEAELAKSEAIRLEIAARAHSMRERVASLEANLRTTDSITPIPSDLKELESWAKAYIEGPVILHSRALRGAKKSAFESPSLVYEALLFFRDFYVPMKISATPERVSACNEELQRLKLENSFVGNAVETHKEKYTVTFEGRPRTLDMHLKNGVSREPHLCFRLYYFWDDETQSVVVGWLTSHLDNAST